jgi:NodT family efflux transporter outer membrane factor (OMF) lipoprotein
MTASVMFGVTLSGCAIGPDYVRPDKAWEPLHNQLFAGAQAARPGAPSLDTWWSGFNDPLMAGVVQQALAQNLDLAASFARVEQARAAASGAGAELLPTVDLDATASARRQSLNSSAGRLGNTFPDYNRHQHEYSVGPAASWEIGLAGGLRRSATAALDEAAVAEAEQAGTRITVAADAADAYLQIRGFQARLAVAQEQVDTDRQLLDLVRIRQQAGVAQDREVAQAEALLNQARTTLPTLRTALEAQLNRLDVLMGIQPGTYARKLSMTGSIPAIPSIREGDQVLDVLRRRPDIIAAERRLAASNERIGAAISGYYPKVSLSAALNFDNTHTRHLFSSQSFEPVAIGGLRWRLFDFGKVDAEVAEARGANAEALALYRQAALRTTEDVENALMTLNQSQVRQQELQDEVSSLTRARDLSEQAYKTGDINLTDVLNANSQLLVARDDLDSTRANSARAAVSVFRALGGGWSPSGEAEKVAAMP